MPGVVDEEKAAHFVEMGQIQKWKQTWKPEMEAVAKVEEQHISPDPQ